MFARLLVTIALLSTGIQAGSLDKDGYIKKAAPVQLARISEYRANAPALTPEQVAALDRMERVVQSFDTTGWEDAKSACIAAFGRDECYRNITAKLGPELVAREATCKCASLDSYCSKKCDDKKKCGYASCE